MVQFSYYHVDLIAGLPDVADSLQTTIQRFGERQRDFNVVKLARTRLSFLLYEHFSEPFPALLTALSLVDGGHQRLLGAVAADRRAGPGGGQRRPGARAPRPRGRWRTTAYRC